MVPYTLAGMGSFSKYLSLWVLFISTQKKVVFCNQHLGRAIYNSWSRTLSVGGSDGRQT